MVNDVALFGQWLTAFLKEAVPHDPLPTRERVENTAGAGNYRFWIVDGEPVAMAGIVRRTRRGAAILAGASVLSASRFVPLVPFPFASPARFSRSAQEPGRASRRLHAGCRSVSLRTSPELIPEGW